jgi:hypothetical protein
LAIRYPIAYSSVAGAVHWNPEKVMDRPNRFMKANDRVGDGLVSLLKDAPQSLVPSLKAYIGRWHEMRAVIFLQLGQRIQCLKEICSSLRYRNVNVKLFVIGLLTCLPVSASQAIYLQFRRFLVGFRSIKK